MYLKTKALVLREVKYKDADKILTLLTEEEGKLSAKAVGALRKDCGYGAASELFCWSEMTLFHYRGKWKVKEALLLEPFLPLRDDLEKLALASYFAELLEVVSDGDRPDRELLRFGLNSLYLLGSGRHSQEHIRAVFEWKLLCLSGFQPALDACCVCGALQPARPCFSPLEGSLYCMDCAPDISGKRSKPGTFPLDGGALQALRYIAAAPPERAYSFSVPPRTEALLGRVTEAFVRTQLERKFGALDYWKSLRIRPHGSL